MCTSECTSTSTLEVHTSQMSSSSIYVLNEQLGSSRSKGPYSLSKILLCNIFISPALHNVLGLPVPRRIHSIIEMFGLVFPSLQTNFQLSFAFWKRPEAFNVKADTQLVITGFYSILVDLTYSNAFFLSFFFLRKNVLQCLREKKKGFHIFYCYLVK